jgi:DNA repair protein RecO (recombination protein O)
VPLYTADALVLRTYKLGEADRIVVFLTRDRGKKRGVAKGARRPRSRFTGALEPMTEVRVAYFEKERRELVGLNYAETRRSPLAFAGLPDHFRQGRVAGRPDETVLVSGSPEANRRGGPPKSEAKADGGPYVQQAEALGYVSYFAELLDEWAQEADADDRLYRLGTSMLDALAAGTPVEPLARYFEYWLLRLQGVYPESRGTLSDAAVAFLAGSRTVAPQHVGSVPAGVQVLRELESVHRTLIAMHLEKTLKSDRVLRDLRRHA